MAGGASPAINQVCQITRLCYMISIYMRRGVHYPPLIAVIGRYGYIMGKAEEKKETKKKRGGACSVFTLVAIRVAWRREGERVSVWFTKCSFMRHFC